MQREIDRHEAAEQSYMDEGVQIFELARNAQKLCERQEPRKSAACSTSYHRTPPGSTAKRATFRQPFDLLAETTAIAARQEAENTGNSAKSEIWLGN